MTKGGSCQPAEYWSRRLQAHFDLRGTGHLSFSPLYNRWVYRRKRRVLRAALADVSEVSPALDVGAGTGWVAAAVRELARVLRPGGALVATDSFGLEDAAPQPHVRFRSAGTWKAAGAAAGLRLEATRPLYSWLSRDRRSSRLVALPDAVRGALEYGLEHALPRPPHLRCATLIRER